MDWSSEIKSECSRDDSATVSVSYAAKLE